jgi:hypothetical protein
VRYSVKPDESFLFVNEDPQTGVVSFIAISLIYFLMGERIKFASALIRKAYWATFASDKQPLFEKREGFIDQKQIGDENGRIYRLYDGSNGMKSNRVTVCSYEGAMRCFYALFKSRQFQWSFDDFRNDWKRLAAFMDKKKVVHDKKSDERLFALMKGSDTLIINKTMPKNFFDGKIENFERDSDSASESEYVPDKRKREEHVDEPAPSAKKKVKAQENPTAAAAAAAAAPAVAAAASSKKAPSESESLLLSMDEVSKSCNDTIDKINERVQQLRNFNYHVQFLHEMCEKAKKRAGNEYLLKKTMRFVHAELLDMQKKIENGSYDVDEQNKQ